MLKKPSKKLLKYPLFFSGITFLITIISSLLIYRSIKVFDDNRFENYSFELEKNIIFKMQTYINALTQTKSMFAASNEVTRVEFKKYFYSLDFLKTYPGIQGMGYTEKVNSENLAKHQQKLKSEGFKDYKVWPEYHRPVYFAVVYLEPFDWRNQRAFGYDMYTNPIRKKAMDRARDTGMPAVSEKVQLVQETDFKPQSGFLIYVPVYENNTNLSSIYLRQRNLKGFVYAPFRSSTLFETLKSELEKNFPIAFEVYSGINDDQLLYSSSQVPSDKSEVLKKEFTFEIAQSIWKIKVRTLPHFRTKSYQITPLVIFFLGTTISFLIFWILWKQQLNSEEAKKRSMMLEKINQLGKEFSSEINLDNLAQFICERSLVTLGARAAELIYYDDEEKRFYAGTLCEEPERQNCKSFEDKIRTPAGKEIGILKLHFTESYDVTSNFQFLFDSVSSQAAIALENAELFKKASDAVKIRDEFLNVASHELKTPITSLKLQFQMAEKMIREHNDKVYDHEAVQRRVKKAVFQLDRMNSLIEDMLDASRVSLSKMTLNQEKVELRQLTLDIIEGFVEQLNAMGIAYSFECSHKQVFINADAYRIEQVISNLISNAIKYGKGSPIKISLNKESQKILLSIEDHGIGIHPDKIDRIFERYERAVKGKDISGLGLGLYISNYIVTAHGGRIIVHSEQDKGSKFTVELPAE